MEEWTVLPYPSNPTDYLPSRSPNGAEIRDLVDYAAGSSLTFTGISDKDHFTREMQSVGTNLACAVDHCAEAAKNYERKLGGNYIHNVFVHTGECASSVLVKTTEAIEIAHQVEGVARRPNFCPKLLYSDTWPNNKEFWEMLFGPQVLGRLGLYHFMQRLVETLRQGHELYHEALQQLCLAIYDWHEDDFEALVKCLKQGLMGNGGEIWTDEEIEDQNMSSSFKKRFEDYLRKKIHQPETIRHKLQIWFDTFKGQQCGHTGKLLFTEDTKPTVINQQKRADDVCDKLPVEQLYRTVNRTERSLARTKHKLLKKRSLHCKSHLESFHLQQAHFANTNM
jgi:hypothetical protein